MRVHTPQDGCYNGRRDMEPTQNPAFRKKQFCLAYWKEHAHNLLTSVLLSLALPAGAAQRPADYFKIVVVDQDTGRGVPLVELRTTYEVSYYTDSNGIVAFYEPGLMNQSVWFSVQSQGYEYPQDFLGSHGTTLEITPGRLALDDPRLFLPAPLYRVAGADGLMHYALRENVQSRSEWQNIQEISFFALPPDRQREGLIPVFAISGERGMVLTLEPPAGKTILQPLFFALPARKSEPGQTLGEIWNCKARDPDGSEFPFTLELKVEQGVVRGHVDQDEIVDGISQEDHIEFQVKLGDDIYHVVGRLQGGKLIGDWKDINRGEGGTWAGILNQSGVAWEKSSDINPLYEYRSADGTHIYSTEPKMPNEQLQRSADPICRVWRNPASLLILDRDANPARE
ncbi:MAG: hypothetical protein WBQ89_22060 [Candidatus Acidiferrum sp.]